MNSLSTIVLITLILCSIILGCLWGSRKVVSYKMKELKEKQTSIDKLIKLKYWFKTIQELIGMCIIGAAVNTIQSGDALTWGMLIYGLLLYVLIAYAIYDFEMTLIDLKKKQSAKVTYDLN